MSLAGVPRSISKDKFGWYEESMPRDYSFFPYSHIRMAGTGENLFILYKDECYIVNKQGTSNSIMKADKEWRFQDIELLHIKNKNLLAIALISENNLESEIRIYDVSKHLVQERLL